MPGTRYTVSVPAPKAGMRLDRFLADSLEGLSRSRLRALIESGHVTDEGGRVLSDPAAKVRTGAEIAVVVPPAAPAEPEPQDIPLDVVFEDDEMLVVNKPRGLVVHPAPGNPDRTLVNALLAHCGEGLSGIGGVTRPGIVHRLDKDTSGLMVVAKTDRAHQALSAELKDRTLKRVYRALVWGVPRPAAGTVEGNIGRDPKNRKKMAVVRRGGKEARTHYRVLETFGSDAALVECRLETGRTHQIRVHLAHIGHPVAGDPLYGPRRTRTVGAAVRGILEGEKGQALHACEVTFRHPVSGENLTFYADYPMYFKELMYRLKSM